MNATEGKVLAALEKNIRVNSGWQDRDYLGLSKINRKACLRALYYEARLRNKKQPPVKALFKCREGYRVQEDLITQLTEAGYMITARELPVNTMFGNIVKGHIEGYIEVDGEEYLLEIKSRNERKFRLCQQTHLPVDIYDQIQLLLFFTGKEKCLLIVKNADSGDHLVKEVKYNPQIAEKLYEITRDAAEAIHRGSLPERGFDPEVDKPCSFCLYRQSCLMNEVN